MKAIITGASSGIGKEFALELAKQGFDLIITARRQDRLEELKKQLEKKYHIQVTVRVADLSIPEEAIAFADEVMAEPIEILINNAGFGKVGDFHETDLMEELSMIQTNIAALHILSKKFILTQNRGYILNMSSIAGHVPSPGFATYGASKAYVLSLSQALAHELEVAGSKISVTAYCPGPVRTEFFDVAGTNNKMPTISAKHCAKAGLFAMFNRKSVAFSDLSTNLLHKGIRLLPTKIATALDYKIQKEKYNAPD